MRTDLVRSRQSWVSKLLVVFWAVFAVGLVGCAPEFWQGVSQGMAASPGVSAPADTHKLMVFGGPGHSTYLGCLNCPEHATDSVFNEYGTHGSPYSSASVFNQYSQFGGPYGAYSPCNAYSSDPPVIVDEAGNFYGRLTVNRYHAQAVRDETILAWLDRVVCK